MAISTEPTRPLEYPLYNSSATVLTELTDDEALELSWPTTDNDERVLIQLELSLSEYVALATSIDVGRDIAYSGDSLKIWWIWVRALQMVDWCAQVLECLTTNEDIQAFLGGFVQDKIAESAGSQLTPGQQQQALNNGSDTCDLDELWGSCLYTVQVLNRLTMDLLETVEAATNNQEAVAYLVEAIPIIGELPVGEFIEFTDKIRDFVKEFYEAGYDVDLEQKFACDLFCRAQANDCQLTMEVITEYFWFEAEVFPGFGGGVFDAASTIVSAIANWEEMTGEAVVTCMFGAQVGFMWWLNSAFGMDFGQFSLQARAGVPDDDWELLCDCTVPNISLIATYPGVLPVFPEFVENTPTGGSIWTCEYYDNGGGQYVVPVRPRIGGAYVCAVLVEATPVTSYQHIECGQYPTLTSGAGDGAGATEWEYFGWIHNTPGTLTIEIEPVTP